MKYLGIDMGGGSVRIYLGTTQPNPRIETIHRFTTPHYTKNNETYWDLDFILRELTQTLLKVMKNQTISSIGIDTWGVDYIRLKDDGSFMQPRHYRDKIHQNRTRELCSEEYFVKTGVQFMPINTANQIVTHQHANPLFLSETYSLLMIGEYIHTYFSGKTVFEKTIRSTTQLLDLAQTLKHKSLHYVDSAPSQFKNKPKVQPKTTVAKDLWTTKPVIHDRAASLFGLKDNEVFIISGTWTLIGMQIPTPLFTKDVFDVSFSNEISADWKIHLLKNIPGMWFFQQLLEDQSILSHHKYTPHSTFIDPWDVIFSEHGDMFAKICSYAKHTNQTQPTSLTDAIHIVMQSLAKSYSRVINDLERVNGKSFTTVNILGGGAQFDVLNQLIANVSGKIVKIGVIESSVIGNIAHQIQEKEGFEQALKFYNTFKTNKLFTPN